MSFFCSPDEAMEWVVDVVVMEQFLDALPPDVQIYVYKFKVARRLANLWMAIHKQGGRSARTRSHNYR